MKRVHKNIFIQFRKQRIEWRKHFSPQAIVTCLLFKTVLADFMDSGGPPSWAGWARKNSCGQRGINSKFINYLGREAINCFLTACGILMGMEEFKILVNTRTVLCKNLSNITIIIQWHNKAPAVTDYSIRPMGISGLMVVMGFMISVMVVTGVMISVMVADGNSINMLMLTQSANMLRSLNLWQFQSTKI